MRRLYEGDIKCRQGGEFGSKYLHRGRDYELGMIRIAPNSTYDVKPHYHKHTEEVFWLLEGEALFWINGDEYIAKPGEVIIMEPGDKHNITNERDSDLVFVFAKSPRLEGDRYLVEDESE
jgi:mannose-6-phosphate isomerase-like protein (cupin superfamily)